MLLAIRTQIYDNPTLLLFHDIGLVSPASLIDKKRIPPELSKSITKIGIIQEYRKTGLPKILST